MAITPLGIHHYAVVTKDLDEATEWYQRVLGLEEERSFGFEDAGIRIAHLYDASSGICIELIERSGSDSQLDAGMNEFGALVVRGSKHIGVLVEDVDSTWVALQALQVDLVAAPTVVEPAGVKNCWIRDRDDVLIEFNQWL